MKKLLFILFLGFSIPFGAVAQLQKGNFQIGGTVNANSSKAKFYDAGQIYNEYKDKDYAISPDLGFFIHDNWVLGLSFKLYKRNSETRYVSGDILRNEYRNNSWGTGIFARRYFPVHEKAAFFGEFKSTVEWNTNKQMQISEDGQQNNSQSYRVFQNSLFTGMAFFPAKWVSMEASLNPLNFGLSRRRNDYQFDHDELINGSFFNMGINSSSIYLGFNFFLSRK